MAIASTTITRAADITVDTARTHQTIEGFGTCLVSWNPEMTRFYETPGAADMYAKELRFNMLRCNLWGDGTIGPVEDPQRISFKDPAFAANDPRTPVFINFAKAIRKINPDVKVIGTVWSPPKWMKENNSIVGGKSAAITATEYVARGAPVTDRVKKEFYPHFAKWLVEMVKHYEANGVPMYAISPANEPQFTQDFESCTWTVPDLAIIIPMIAEELKRAKLERVKIFGMESMSGFNWMGGPNRAFATAVQQDKALRDGLDVFATHGYIDGFAADQGAEAAAGFWELVKELDKPHWLTEGGTGGHEWAEVIGDKGVAAGLHNAFVAGNVSAWVPWQFAEPKPNEHCLTTTAGPTKKTWVVRQYSRFVPVNAVRVAAEPAYGDVNVSAFVTNGRGGVAGRFTAILTNHSQRDQDVRLSLRGPGMAQLGKLTLIRTSATEDGVELPAPVAAQRELRLTVPAQSVVTLTNVR
jgi:O-glycosyl hydrolase